MVGSINESHAKESIAPETNSSSIVTVDNSSATQRMTQNFSPERIDSLRLKNLMIRTLCQVAGTFFPLIMTTDLNDYENMIEALSNGDDAIKLKFDFQAFPYISLLSKMYFTKSYEDLNTQERLILKTHYPFDSPLPKENFKTPEDYCVHAFLFNNGVFQIETSRPDDHYVDQKESARQNYDATRKNILSLSQEIQTLAPEDIFLGAILPPEISRLTELQSLILDNYGNLTPEIAHLKKLETLVIRDYYTERLCPQIGELINLKKLTISMKHLKSLPDTLLNLSSLTHLTILANDMLKEDPVLKALFAKGCQKGCQVGWVYF